MDMGDMFKQMFDKLGQTTKRGGKICELKPEDVAIHEAMLNKAVDLTKQKEALDLEFKLLEIQSKQWWLRVVKDYRITQKGITYDDGVLYELHRVNADGSLVEEEEDQ